MEETKQTAAIPVKATVTVQLLAGGIWIVEHNGSSAMAASPAAMHVEINKAFGIEPVKREHKAK